MPRASRLTPLREIHAVILDTETTGLDVTHDRLIQIGATRFQEGQKVENETFSVRLDPRQPIVRSRQPNVRSRQLIVRSRQPSMRSDSSL